MKNIFGGSHSKSCPVKHIAGPRMRGRMYREACGCDVLPWEACGCLNDSAIGTEDNVTGASNGSLYPAKGSAPSPSPEIATARQGAALRG